jgi:hypothetical protein
MADRWTSYRGAVLPSSRRKSVLHYDRNILLSERFKAGRPNGVPYKMPQPEFRAANAVLAEALVHDIVAVLEDRIREMGRPQKSSEHLINALLDERNRASDANGFWVGNDEFLQDSAAGRYFRNLEYGSTVFVGRIIEGFFAGANGRPIEPGQGRAVAGAKDALRLVQTGNFKNQAETRAGRFKGPDPYGNPSRSSRTEGEFPVAGGGGVERHIEGGGANHRGPSRPILIRNPIPAYYYFRDGIAVFRRRAQGPGGLIAEEYRRAAATFVERGGLIIE